MVPGASTGDAPLLPEEEASARDINFSTSEMEEGTDADRRDSDFDDYDCELCKGRAPRHRPESGAPPPWWRPRHHSTQRRLAKVLESRRMHITIVALTILDLCIVITELSLFSFYPVEEERPPAVQDAEDVLAWISVSILSIFTLEQFAKLIVFGIRYFMRFWHAFDAIIIVTSLILESLLRGPARDTVALLVVFRLWRIVRVMHGITEVETVEHEEELKRHHRAEAAMAARVAQLEAQLAAARARERENGGTDGGAIA